MRSSITPEIEKILADQFMELIKDGAHGFQMDKVCVAAALDFNPLNTLKPDVALCEGLVQAIDRLHKKCKALNPDFCMASEFGYDRLLPYFDVGYRNAGGYDISTFRYVFPEWTSCVHIFAPRDFRGVNGAILTGSVICVEPDAYQGSLDQPIYRDLATYIQEVERIRNELSEIIFTGKYYDSRDAKVLAAANMVATEKNEQSRSEVATPGAMPAKDRSGALTLKESDAVVFRVHGHQKTDQRAIVIVNDLPDSVQYVWEFTHQGVNAAKLYAPFAKVRSVKQGDPVQINGGGLQILLEQ